MVVFRALPFGEDFQQQCRAMQDLIVLYQYVRV